MEKPHVQVTGLTVARGGHVLVRDLNLDVSRGCFLAVVGPSGVGKSSLLETLGGICSPAQGSITYRCRRECLHSPGDFRCRIGFVFQQLHLARNATVLQNVLAGSLHRHPWWKTLFGLPLVERQRAFHWMQVLGLRRYSHKLVRQISGGEQQRVAIARALLQEPELILADEPVSHLDRALAEEVLNALKTEARQSARTVLCVLHDPALVTRFADAVLDLGKGPRGDGQWAFSG
jgi:phosphonate transport system ATP-binding protein